MRVRRTRSFTGGKYGKTSGQCGQVSSCYESNVAVFARDFPNEAAQRFLNVIFSMLQYNLKTTLILQRMGAQGYTLAEIAHLRALVAHKGIAIVYLNNKNIKETQKYWHNFDLHFFFLSIVITYHF